MIVNILIFSRVWSVVSPRYMYWYNVGELLRVLLQTSVLKFMLTYTCLMLLQVNDIK